MALNPTPTKVVLLMSAAGLGLSLADTALAGQDNAAPGIAWTFGTLQRSEQGCASSCPLPGGEILRTVVAEASALPLPMAPAPPSRDAGAWFRASNAYAPRSTRWPDEASMGDGRPEPSKEALRPEAPVATRVVEAASRGPEVDVVALVLPDSPQGTAPATAAPSGSPDSSAAVARLVPDPLATEELSLVAEDKLSEAPAGATAGAPASQRTRTRAKLDGAVAAPVRAKPGSAHEGKTTAAFADDQVSSPSLSAFQTSDRSAPGAQAGSGADAALADSVSIDRVFASLAEVLGTQPEESPLALKSSQPQDAAPPRTLADPAAAAPAAVDVVRALPAPALDAARHDSRSLRRAREADDILVAPSHSDKVLLSLAALRSGEPAGSGRLGARTKKTVVTDHADKVLETLALFQPKPARHSALACTPATEEQSGRGMPSNESSGDWELPGALDALSATAFAHEPDILLDLPAPVAAQPVRSALSAVPEAAARSEPPAADRSDRRAIGNELVALSSDKLDEVRGGFVTDSGLKVSFGIERAVYLNGSLVTTTSLNIADLSKIAGGQAQASVNGPGTLGLVQSGAGNTFAPGTLSSTAAGTVIQNTLDNQKINTITRIDAVVNSANIMRSINLQSSMRSAIINSLGR